MLQVALDVHLGLLAVGRCRQRDHPEHARAHPLGDPFDYPALPGGVTAFEHDADLDPLAHDPLLQPNQLPLQTSELLLVALTAKLLDPSRVLFPLLPVTQMTTLRWARKLGLRSKTGDPRCPTGARRMARPADALLVIAAAVLSARAEHHPDKGDPTGSCWLSSSGADGVVVAVVTVVVRGGEVTVMPVVVVLVGCTIVVVLLTLTDFVVGVDELVVVALLLVSSTTTTTTAAMASAIPPAIAQPRPPPPRSGAFGRFPGARPVKRGPRRVHPPVVGGGSKFSDMPQPWRPSEEMHHPDRMMARPGPKRASTGLRRRLRDRRRPLSYSELAQLMLLAPVPAVVAPVLASDPPGGYPTDSYRGSAGHRGGPHDRSPSITPPPARRRRPNISDSFLVRCLIRLDGGRWPGSGSGRLPPTGRPTVGTAEPNGAAQTFSRSARRRRSRAPAPRRSPRRRPRRAASRAPSRARAAQRGCCRRSRGPRTPSTEPSDSFLRISRSSTRTAPFSTSADNSAAIAPGEVRLVGRELDDNVIDGPQFVRIGVAHRIDLHQCLRAVSVRRPLRV